VAAGTAKSGKLSSSRNIETVGSSPPSRRWGQRFRRITSKHAFRSAPEEPRALKIPRAVVPLWVADVLAARRGARQHPANEAYSALTDHASDGQGTPWRYRRSAKILRGQKFCSLTKPSWDGFWLIGRQRLEAPAQGRAGVLPKHFNADARSSATKRHSPTAEYQKVLDRG